MPLSFPGLALTRKLMSRLSSAERKLLEEFPWPLEKIRPYALFLGKRTRHNRVENMFFEFEELPALGKEYWFLYLSDPVRDRQFIGMFGRGQGAVNIQRSRLTPSKTPGSGTRTPLMALYWSLDGGSKRSGKFRSNFQAIRGHANSITDQEGRLSLRGRFPAYSLTLNGAGRKACDARFSSGKADRPFELGHFTTGPFGFEVVNLFLNFKGTLHGKPFSGPAYVQKVVAVGPFIPWNWARVNFPDGSFLDFFALHFTPKTSFGTLSKTRAKFWDAKRRRARNLKGLSLQKRAGGWMLVDRAGKALLWLVPEGKHDFLFQSTGSFHYDQYFVRAVPSENGRPLAGRKLEEGLGLVEDAYGFML